MMKRGIAIMLFLTYSLFTQGQASPVDKIFEKYSGKEGFTSIQISQYMFNLFSNSNPENKEFNEAIKGISGIKILATDATEKGLLFQKELTGSLPSKDYKELMVITEKDQKLTFLVKDTKGKVIELLLIISGGENVLISIQGSDINMKQISRISQSMNIDALGAFDKIQQD